MKRKFLFITAIFIQSLITLAIKKGENEEKLNSVMIDI